VQDQSSILILFYWQICPWDSGPRISFCDYNKRSKTILSIDPGLDGRRSTYQKH
jgi:hypothetical protein